MSKNNHDRTIRYRVSIPVDIHECDLCAPHDPNMILREAAREMERDSRRNPQYRLSKIGKGVTTPNA